MMEQSLCKNKRYHVVLSGLLSLIVLLWVLSVCCGRYHISVASVVDILFCQGQNAKLIDYNVVMQSRVPRAAVAMLTGMALSVAGLLYQTIFNNHLVSPDLLGASSGASVGACIGILLGLSSGTTAVMAFVVGISAVVVTVCLSHVVDRQSDTILLLSGIVVSGLMDSVVGVTKFLADSDGVLAELTFWLMGDLSKVKNSDILFLAPVVLLGCGLVYLVRWKLNVLSLGALQARTIGMRYTQVQYLLMAVATLLTAAVVSVAGNIGWVGLVVPHIARLMVGNNTKQTVPVAIATGAAFMLLVDLFARTLSYAEIPISIVTGFLGSPVFMLLLFYGRNGVKHD